MAESASKRLWTISTHLNNIAPLSPNEWQIITQEYYAQYYQHQHRMRKVFEQSQNFNMHDFIRSSIKRQREISLIQIKEIYSQVQITKQLDNVNPVEVFHPLMTLNQFNGATAVRFLVHLLLYTDSIRSLGTEKHYPLIDRAYALKDYGCFALTELGHGSNAAQVQTTATYNHKTRSFTIHSPTHTATKWWIGAAASTANMAIIFAKLIIEGVDKGVHCFVTPIRNYETHQVLDGITIGDCGLKAGNDNIDNGYIIFNNFEVPYDSLLDKFSQVKPDGKFKNFIKTDEKRFGLVLSGLIRGRIGVNLASEITLRSTLTAAVRFAFVRKQFGTPEQPIMNLQLHQCRLIPFVAILIANRATSTRIFELLRQTYPIYRKNPQCQEWGELHSIVACIKANTSSNTFQGIQMCREACGGFGYSSYSVFPQNRRNHDAHQTWEGDNSVLVQQTSRYIIKQLQKVFKGEKIQAQTLQFLTLELEHFNPAYFKFESEQDLKNEDLLRSLLELRVNILVLNTINAIQKNSAHFDNMFDVWNNTQVHFIQDLAFAYADMFQYTSLADFMHRVHSRSPTACNWVKDFLYLFGVKLIKQYQGFFMECGMSPSQAVLVQNLYVKLCLDLAEVSLEFLNAIAQDDKILGSVLANREGDFYQRFFDTVKQEEGDYHPAFEVIQNLRKEK